MVTLCDGNFLSHYLYVTRLWVLKLVSFITDKRKILVSLFELNKWLHVGVLGMSYVFDVRLTIIKRLNWLSTVTWGKIVSLFVVWD